jgi:hypothetical protein
VQQSCQPSRLVFHSSDLDDFFNAVDLSIGTLV